MEKGQSYVQYGVLPRQGAIEALAKLKTSTKWKDNCRILDIGCGPGNVTHDYLLPTLPTSTKEIIGIDISEEYIKYAEFHYGKNPILSYQLMDIVNDEVPKEYHNYFDYAISFLCFQQFNNHKTAFEKIKKMLKPDGEMFCYFPTSTKSTDIFQCLVKQEKWKRYLHNYELYCSPYKGSFNVEEDVKRFLTEMGFKILYLNFEERQYNFLDKNLPNITRALAYENMKVPEDLFHDFQADAVAALRSLYVMKINENNEEYYDFSYKLVTFHIIKENTPFSHNY